MGFAEVPHTEGSREQCTRLRLLDGFELRVGEAYLDLPLASQRVVAFLALQARPAQRADVADKLWFGTTDTNPHACLRSALWRLHCSFPVAPLVEATRVQLRLASHVQVDVREQAALAARLLNTSAELETNLDYSTVLAGKLLPGWYDEWVLFERERLRHLRLHALEAIVKRLTEQERHAEAIAAALEAVRDDPLRESAQRVLIKAYLAEGNQADAIRQYRAFRELLKKRLGVDPSADLGALLCTLAAGPARDRIGTS